ncbi:MAG: hypothetical protein P4L51_28555 [Puia sp.]|nr:hypothetical protein [Puia sp.]
MILLNEGNTALQFLKTGSGSFNLDPHIPAHEIVRYTSFMQKQFPLMTGVFSRRIQYITRSFIETYPDMELSTIGKFLADESGTFIIPRSEGYDTIFYHFNLNPKPGNPPAVIVAQFYTDEYLSHPTFQHLEQIDFAQGKESGSGMSYRTEFAFYLASTWNLCNFLSQATLTPLFVPSGESKELDNRKYKNDSGLRIQLVDPRLMEHIPRSFHEKGGLKHSFSLN